MVDIRLDITTFLFSVVTSGLLALSSLWFVCVYLFELRQQIRELRGLMLSQPKFTPVSSEDFESIFETTPEVPKKERPLEDKLADFNASMDMDF